MRSTRAGWLQGVAVALAPVFGITALAAWLSARVENLPGTAARYATTFILLESAVMIAMIAGLVTAKAIRSRRERIVTRRKQAIEDLLTGDGEIDPLQAVAARWPKEAMEVADEALGFLSGPVRGRILRLMESSACRALLLRAVISDRPREAARAVRLLSEFQNEECWSAVTGSLQHPSEKVRAAARSAILRNGGTASQLRVLTAIRNASLWERLGIFHSMSFRHEAVRRFLQDALASSDEGLTIAALDLVNATRQLAPVPVPSALASSSNVEVRIRFFKALPYFGVGNDSTDVLAGGIHDPNWRVRAMAAQACTHFRPSLLVQDLLAMCWTATNPAEVRHAANALATLGGEAHFQLERFACGGCGVASQIAAEALENRILDLLGARR